MLDHEIGHHLDILLLEDVPEVFGGDRLGECARQRRGVGDLHPVAEPLLVEEPIGQHDELQRRDRALDRVLDHVDHHAPALPGAQVLGQSHCALNRVEIVDRRAPFMLLQARGFLRMGLRAGGDHQEIVTGTCAHSPASPGSDPARSPRSVT